MYDLTDQIFGKLRVLARDMAYTGSGQEVRWFCACECGAVVSVRSYLLRKGKQVSCGCSRGFKLGNTLAQKHGYHDTATYTSWEQMKQRCTNPKYPNYKYYGAQGVAVCDEWREFANFLKDMGERPEGTSLDRINPFGNYEPNNCRWATPTEQANNKRSSRRSSVHSC